jgi:hypothetical protein
VGGGHQPVRTIQTPVLAKLLSLKISIGADLEILAIPFYENFAITRVNICNLHPNSVLAVSIFITLYESYLGIQPHFNLWRHFFCIKKKGGAGGSKIARGAYLNL